MTDHTGKAVQVEPMPWLVAVKLRCVELASDAQRQRSIPNFEEEADRRLRWVLGRELYNRLIGPTNQPEEGSRKGDTQGARSGDRAA